MVSIHPLVPRGRRMPWLPRTTYRRRIRRAAAAAPRPLLARPRRSRPGDAGSGPQGGGSRPPRPFADEPQMPPVEAPHAREAVVEGRGKATAHPAASCSPTARRETPRRRPLSWWGAPPRGARAAVEREPRCHHPGGHAQTPGGPSPAAASRWRVGRGSDGNGPPRSPARGATRARGRVHTLGSKLDKQNK